MAGFRRQPGPGFGMPQQFDSPQPVFTRSPMPRFTPTLPPAEPSTQPPVVEVRSARLIPISGLIVTATTLGGAQTLFTVPNPGVCDIHNLTVTNTTGTAATLTLHMKPSGVTAGQVTEELDAYSVPANTTLQLKGLLAGPYAPDTECLVFSGTNGSLTVRAGLSQER